LPANPPKNLNEINGAQQAKIRSTKDILDAEVWGGRAWQHATTSDGIEMK
jgi:hypothetical protein